MPDPLPRRFRWSLFSACALLSVAAIGVVVLYRADRNQARQDLQFLADDVAREAGRELRHRLDLVRLSLTTTTQFPEVRFGDWKSAGPILSGLKRANPDCLALGVVGADGTWLAGERSVLQTATLTGRAELAQSVSRRGFVVGEPEWDLMGGRAWLPCAVPVGVEDGGGAQAVAWAALHLAWLGDVAEESAWPTATSMAAFDGRGRLVFPGSLLAKIGVEPTPLGLGALSAGGQALELPGLDGLPRWTGASRVPGDGPGLFVCVSRDAAALYASADGALWGNAFLAAIVVALFLGCALLGAPTAQSRTVPAPPADPPSSPAEAPPPPAVSLPLPASDPAPITPMHLQDARELVRRVQHQTRTIGLLNEMTEVLQACNTAEEAYASVGRFAQVFFADAGGAILAFQGSPDTLVTATVWGSVPGGAVGGRFARTDCLALVRGAPVRVEDTHAGEICRHVGEPRPAATLCLPLTSKGETLGVLHLAIPARAPGIPLVLNETRQMLGMKLADHIALTVSGLKERELLRTQSVSDALTGLYNRRHMEARLEEEVHRAQRRSRTLGVMMLDIDHFKRINDTYGHDAGDHALRTLAEFLRGQFRESDVLCRYGGEEFLVILPEASLEDTRARADALRSRIRHVAFSSQGRPLPPLTLSVGVASFPQHAASPDDLVKAADAALYRAKHAGRDRVEVAQSAPV